MVKSKYYLGNDLSDEARDYYALRGRKEKISIVFISTLIVVVILCVLIVLGYAVYDGYHNTLYINECRNNGGVPLEIGKKQACFKLEAFKEVIIVPR